MDEVRRICRLPRPSEQSAALDKLEQQLSSMRPVLQDWVMGLPLRAQGVLLTGIRGCDLAPKNPICIDEAHGCSTGEATAERQLAAFLRFCVLHPADQREVDIPGAWFKSSPPENWKPSQFGHYPLHWFSHMMHCFQVVAYHHPEPKIKIQTGNIYHRMVNSLHLQFEPYEFWLARMTEDRLENDTVVS